MIDDFAIEFVWSHVLQVLAGVILIGCESCRKLNAFGSGNLLQLTIGLHVVVNKFVGISADLRVLTAFQRDVSGLDFLQIALSSFANEFRVVVVDALSAQKLRCECG
jgi:hypothetical protein